MVQGLGFRVEALGFRVSGFGFGVWGLGLGVWGLECGVWSLPTRVGEMPLSSNPQGVVRCGLGLFDVEGAPESGETVTYTLDHIPIRQPSTLSP